MHQSLVSFLIEPLKNELICTVHYFEGRRLERMECLSCLGENVSVCSSMFVVYRSGSSDIFILFIDSIKSLMD